MFSCINKKFIFRKLLQSFSCFCEAFILEEIRGDIKYSDKPATGVNKQVSPELTTPANSQLRPHA